MQMGFKKSEQHVQKVWFAQGGNAVYGMQERFTMPEQENDILDLESQFPAVSGSAFAAARERTLNSGQSVLQSEQGVIYEVFPDGTRKEVKRIAPPTQIERGTKVIIQ
jgi:hypothetical protein